MAKPPPTPPSSDIDGVDEDRQRIDRPANSVPSPQDELNRQNDEARARPPAGR